METENKKRGGVLRLFAVLMAIFIAAGTVFGMTQMGGDSRVYAAEGTWIYVDGANGNDSNDGSSVGGAVKSWEKAKSLLGNKEGGIYVSGTVQATGNINTENSGKQSVKRADGFTGVMFEVPNGETATFYNIDVDGEDKQIDAEVIKPNSNSTLNFLSGAVFHDIGYYEGSQNKPDNTRGGRVSSLAQDATIIVDGATFRDNDGKGIFFTPDLNSGISPIKVYVKSGTVTGNKGYFYYNEASTASNELRIYNALIRNNDASSVPQRYTDYEGRTGVIYVCDQGTTNIRTIEGAGIFDNTTYDLMQLDRKEGIKYQGEYFDTAANGWTPHKMLGGGEPNWGGDDEKGYVNGDGSMSYYYGIKSNPSQGDKEKAAAAATSIFENNQSALVDSNGTVTFGQFRDRNDDDPPVTPSVPDAPTPGTEEEEEEEEPEPQPEEPTTPVVPEENETTDESPEAKAQIVATKTLEGRELKANEFTFELYAADEEGNIISETAIDTQKNDAEGKVTFKEIEYVKAGKYNYIVKEVVPEEKEEGMTYDDNNGGKGKLVTVTVTERNSNSGKNTNNNYTVSDKPHYVDLSSAYPNTPTATIGVRKTLEGDRAIKEGEFEFELWNYDNTQLIATASNDAEGFATFKLGGYSLQADYEIANGYADRGYYVKEVVNKNNTDIEYDSAATTGKHIVITITDTSKVNNDVSGLIGEQNYVYNSPQKISGGEVTYCVNKGRAYGSESGNRFKYAVSANDLSALQAALNKNATEMGGSRARDEFEYVTANEELLNRLKAVLYYGYPNNGAGDNFTYDETQNAIYKLIYFGKDGAPSYSGAIHNDNGLLAKAKSQGLPANVTGQVFVHRGQKDSAQDLVSATFKTKEVTSGSLVVTSKDTEFVNRYKGEPEEVALTATATTVSFTNKYEETTVEYNGSLGTTVFTNKGTASANAALQAEAGSVEVKDKISYTNLQPNNEYKVYGELVKVGDDYVVDKVAGPTNSFAKTAQGKYFVKARNNNDATWTEATADQKTMADKRFAGMADNVEVSWAEVKDLEKMLGMEVVATKQATPNKKANAQGTGEDWIMTFGNVTLEAGAKYVVFESAENADSAKAEAGDKAEHHDAGDASQTIIVKETTETQPEITNTTANVGGVSADEDNAAEYTLQEGETEATLSDTIKFTNLDASKTYEIRAIAYDANGKEVRNKPATVSGKTEGDVTIDFDRKVGEGTYKIKATIKDTATGEIVAEHNGDLKETSETAIVDKIYKAPGVETDANGAEGNTIAPAEGQSIVDNVTLTDLVEGVDYKLTGKLMIQDGSANGTEVTKYDCKEVNLTAEDIANGTAKVTFTNIDASELAGKTLVVFETLSWTSDKHGDTKEVKHEDINDDAQSVAVDQPGSVNVKITGKKGFKDASGNAVDSPVSNLTDMFQFGIYDENDQLIKTTGNQGFRKTTSNGSIYAGFDFKYTEAGTYTYKIKENKEYKKNDADYTGISIDAPDQTVIVKVVKDGSDLKVDSVTGGDYKNGIITVSFTGENGNTYEAPTPVQVKVSASKTIDGDASKVKKDAFKFVIFGEDGKAVLAAGGNGDGSRIVKAGGSLYQPFILPGANEYYTEAGTYTYTIKEDATYKTDETLDYDVTEKQVKVVVTLNEETNAFEAKVNETAVANGGTFDAGVFNNTTKPKNEAAPTAVVIKTKKTLEGKALEADEFTFALNGSGQKQTAKNKANGEVEFKEIKYTAAGEYTYTISENKGSKPGMTYDDSDKTVKVKVNLNEETNALEIADVTGGALAGGVITVEGEGFANTYTEPDEPAIGTTATDGADEDKTVVAEAEAKVVDVVEYVALKPNTKYTVTGTLMNKKTGKEFKVDGKAVTKTAEFTTDATGCGTVKLEFVFDASALKTGDSLVAFEAVSDENGEVAVHKDLNDAAQTVDIVTPDARTTATDNYDGDKILGVAGETEVKDVVKYTNLTPGKTYTLEGKLVTKSSNGKTVVAAKETTFTPDAADGETELTFKVNTLELAGEKLVAFETVKYAGKEVVVHADINDGDQTVEVETPEIKTTATDAADGDSKVTAEAKAKVKDVVEYKNLIPGKKYTMSGELVKKSDKTVVATAEKDFTADDSGSGKVTLTFTFDASDLAGESAVAFETAKDGDDVIAVHADINDRDQTVEIEEPEKKDEKPEIKTTATDNADGDKQVTAESKAQVKDVVKYEKLIAGKKYTMEGQLVRKSDKSVVATASKEFTAAQNGKGSVTLVFEFDASKLAGQSAVAFETAKDGDNVVATHADLNDADQTVDIVKPEVKTTAEDAADHDKNLAIAETVTVKDIVEYTNLTKGKEYTLSGKLVTKSDGGKTVVATASKKFTPEAANGTEELEFTVNTTDLQGEKLVVFETVTYNNKEVAVHADINDADQTVEVEKPEKKEEKPEIKTTATDNADGDKQVTAESKAQVKDVVKYENLIEGRTYTMEGQLVKKSDGSVVATASKEFTAAAGGAGEVELVFEFDASELAGQSAVAFETAKDGDNVVATHADLNDADQTVDIVKPEVKTTAEDAADQDKNLAIAETVKVKDIVEYTNLTKGKEYTLSGKLVTKSDGGKTVVATASKKFTPEAANGTEELEFTVNTTDLQGEKLVVFETVTYNNKEVAVHADINDADQTVEVEKPEKKEEKPEIKTTATDNADGDKQVTAESKAQVKDVVKYEKLIAGKKYTMEGQLVRKSDKSVVATASKEFTAAAGGAGEVELVFEFDASKLAGESAVAFETVKEGNVVIATHADLNDADQTVEIVKPEEKTHEVKINKTDLGGTEIDGATIVVKDASGAEVATWESKAGETCDLELTAGTYTFKETVAPEGFKKVTTSIGFEVDENGNVTVLTTEVVNGKVEVREDGTIVLFDEPLNNPAMGTTATDKNDGDKVLAYAENVTVVDVVSYSDLDTKTTYKLSGKLVMKEDPAVVLATAETEFTPQAADGTETAEFTFDASNLQGKELVVFETLTWTELNENNETVTKTLVHEDVNDTAQTVKVKEWPSVQIRKTDAATTEELKGAKLTVYDAAGEVVDTWYSNGTAHVITVKPGTYTLVEDQAPVGYNTAESITFEVDENGVVGGPVEMKDAPYVEVSFTKSELGGEELEGATITIYPVNEDGTLGEAVETWVSTKEPHKIKLADGNYVMHEDAAPNGYYVATDIPFTVESGNAEATASVNMDDRRWGEVTISKTDAATSEELVGATLIVEKVNEDGTTTVIEKWVSEAEPHKIRLEKGTYTLTEITAPEGYNVAETIQFTVNEEGLVEGEKVEMLDRPYTEVTFSKQDLGGVEIGGATIRILNDKGWVIDQWTSVEGESHKIKLPDGNYVMHEEVAPHGYFVATDIPFVVKAGAAYNTTYVDMKDAPWPTVEISKQDATDKTELPGAKLEVRDAATGTLIESWTSTEESKKVQLAPGTYTLTEITAPDGYEVAETITFTVNEEGLVGGDKVTMYDAKKSVEKTLDQSTVNVVLEKTWTDAAGNVVEWPAGKSASFTLEYFDGSEWKAYRHNGSDWTVTLTAQDPTYMFEALPDRINGQVAKYRAVEIKIDGYKQAVSTETDIANNVGIISAVNVPEGTPGKETPDTPSDIKPQPDSKEEELKPGTDSPTDVPGDNTPGTDTPGTDTPGTDTPGTGTPGTDTPGTDTPGTSTPGRTVTGSNVPATTRRVVTTPTAGASTVSSSRATATGDNNNSVIWIIAAALAAAAIAGAAVVMRRRRHED